jgi:hypothetical protein
MIVRMQPLFAGGYRIDASQRRSSSRLPAVNGPATYPPQDHTGQDFRSLAMGRLEKRRRRPAGVKAGQRPLPTPANSVTLHLVIVALGFGCGAAFCRTVQPRHHHG